MTMAIVSSCQEIGHSTGF